jgi:superfamily II DNA or RNA helicase
MGTPLRLTSATQTRARIANLILGEHPIDVTLGDVALHQHQVSAVPRIRMAIREFGGALLCDEVGMGKTFVAAAIAREYLAPLVVAPAALAQMWRDALTATDIQAGFVSFEKLSRLPGSASQQLLASPNSPRPTPGWKYDLVIVDEAHHARNHATRRHARLKELTRDAKVLLLSATPIHNRRGEMSSVLSLFLGSRAAALTPAEIARCVLRREHAQLQSHTLIPRVAPVRTLRVSDNPSVVRDLMSLPDPVPVRDGGSGGVLIGRGLVHQWASSEAALHAALRRRIARAWAMIASLEAGTYPSERELRAWTFDDGALQLGFPELLSAKIGDIDALLDSVKRHANALDAFTQHSRQAALDVERARHLLAIRRSHPGAKIVAFSQYAPTVSMLYRELQSTGGVAILTSQGARVVGGKLSRRDALARFAPDASKTSRPPPSEAIELLLTTDLLSEGVNLQDAQIIVHLDLPWTAARIEQRVGRVARMGSPHAAIYTYLIRPPESADDFLGTESMIASKWDVARRVVGSNAPSPLSEPEQGKGSNQPQSVSQLTESLRAILESWRYPESSEDGPNAPGPDDDMCVAAVESGESGFLAAVELEQELQLVVSISGDVSTNLESQIAASKLGSGVDVEASCDDVEYAQSDIRRWAEAESASAMAGIAFSKSLNRRRFVNRIDRAIENAPPHSRSIRITVAAQARAVVASHQSAAIEAELASLADSDLSDDEWLEAIAQLQPSNHPTPSRAAIRDLRIHALLLLSAVK